MRFAFQATCATSEVRQHILMLFLVSELKQEMQGKNPSQPAKQEERPKTRVSMLEEIKGKSRDP